METKVIKTIEIAPSRKNTRIRGNKIIGHMSDGSRTYIATFPEHAHFIREEYPVVKDAFSQAIFLCSKKWQAEDLLSRVFGCPVTMEIIEHDKK